MDMGCTMRCKGRAFGDNVRFRIQCLVEKIKLRNGKAQDHLHWNEFRNK